MSRSRSDFRRLLHFARDTAEKLRGIFTVDSTGNGGKNASRSAAGGKI